VWEEVKDGCPLILWRKDLLRIKQWVLDFLQRESAMSAMVLVVTF
jgi:hypothetical protein